MHGTTPSPTLAATRWGLTPSWARANRPLLHARAETATTKPTFRDAALTRRAIVPCEGWTEWRTTGEPRKRFWARRAEAHAPAHLAALAWGTPAAITASFVIVTTASAPSMALIHHRQPLCLEGEEIAAWLDTTTAIGDIEAILAAGSKREPGLSLKRAGGTRC